MTYFSFAKESYLAYLKLSFQFEYIILNVSRRKRRIFTSLINVIVNYSPYCLSRPLYIPLLFRRPASYVWNRTQYQTRRKSMKKLETYF